MKMEDEIKKTAKEFAKQFRLTHYKQIGCSSVELPSDVVKDIEERIEKAYIDGAVRGMKSLGFEIVCEIMKSNDHEEVIHSILDILEEHQEY